MTVHIIFFVEKLFHHQAFCSPQCEDFLKQKISLGNRAQREAFGKLSSRPSFHKRNGNGRVSKEATTKLPTDEHSLDSFVVPESGHGIGLKVSFLIEFIIFHFIFRGNESNLMNNYTIQKYHLRALI